MLHMVEINVSDTSQVGSGWRLNQHPKVVPANFAGVRSSLQKNGYDWIVSQIGEGWLKGMIIRSLPSGIQTVKLGENLVFTVRWHS